MEQKKENSWRKFGFINKEWQKSHAITRRKKIHYEASDEDKGRYMSYFKTKRT